MIKVYNYFNGCRILLSAALIFLGSVFGCASNLDKNTSLEMETSTQSKVIRTVTTQQDNDKFNVYLRGSNNLTFTSVKQPFPTGVILYFPDTKIADIPREFDFTEGIVETIKLSSYNPNNSTARIEIILKQDVGYQVSKQNDGLRISFNQEAVGLTHTPLGFKDEPLKSNQIIPATYNLPINENPSLVTTEYASASSQYDDQAQPQIQMLAANTANSQNGAKPVNTSETASKNVPSAWMNRIDFSSESNGKSTLIVGTTTPITYELRKKAPTKVEIILFNTGVPKYRQRPLITTRFKSAVDRIMPFQTPATGNSSIVSIELREEVPYFVEQTDTLLMVHFEPSSIEPRPLTEADLPDWQQVIMQSTLESPPEPVAMDATPENMPEPIVKPENLEPGKTEEAPQYTDSDITESMAYAAGEFGSGKKKYIGEKIALDFYKTDIKNVFRILREVSGKNFAIDKDVNGSVTLTLDKPVPWDQIMDLILKMNQLGMIYEHDIIRIATLETLRKEEDQRSAQLEAAKKAQLQKEALEPIYTEYIAVNYSQAATEVVPHVKNILTKDRGTVSVDGRNNQIIITDTKDVIKQAREIVRRIDKVTPQVVIEARIVEVSSDFSRELGVTWDSEYGEAHSNMLDMDVTSNLAMNFPASSATSNVGIYFSKLDGIPFVLNAQINALESQGDGKILSSPKIVTLDNKKARIKQGLEYPYLERDDSGGSSVKFKDIDLLLEVTPHVTPDNRISMSIFITKNDVAALTDGVPSISTNEAETELLVNDGDTIVIGGIIKASETGEENGFPGLSKIPVLGWLFKNESHSSSKNELLIFMTPRIVQLEQL